MATDFDFNPNRINVVPAEGLEPPRVAPPDPKSGASANSATPARVRAALSSGFTYARRLTLFAGIHTAGYRLPGGRRYLLGRRIA